MELKPYPYSSHHQTHPLLIRPEWNWNSLNPGSHLITDGTFNQTRMELKPVFLGSHNLTRSSLLIRPEWNWNDSLTVFGEQDLRLLIRPEWNWNLKADIINVFGSWLVIRPEWNWNTAFCAAVETSSTLLIRPEWNWNIFLGFLDLLASPF